MAIGKLPALDNDWDLHIYKFHMQFKSSCNLKIVVIV